MDKKRRKRTVITRPTHDSCRTCRFRRVKCDATRPVCQRCLDAGRACGGYAVWTVDLSLRGPEAKADVSPSAQTSDSGSSFIKDEHEVSDDFLSSEYTVSSASSDSGQGDEKWTYSQPVPIDEKWESESALVPISHYQITQTPPPPPLYIMDDSIVRDQQIFAIFAEAHSNRAQSGSHERVLNMIVADHATSPLVGKTLRALSWAYASSVDHKNKQILHAARASYGNAMVAVSSKLNAIQTGRECGETSLAMLTGIQMLGLYQDSSQRFSSRPQPNWQIHIRGAQEYAKSCGPAAEGWGEHLVAIWFMGFSTDLAKRRAGPLDLRDWRNSPVKSESGGVPIDRWFPAVLPLPALLQIVDKFLTLSPTILGPTGRKKLLDLVYQLDCVRNDVVNWIDQIVPRQPIAVDETKLDPMLEEHQVLLLDKTFPTQYKYLDSRTKFKMFALFSQIIVLIADCALLRLTLHFSPSTTTIPDSNINYNILHQAAIIRNVEEDAYRIACNLCQEVYALSKVNSVLYALLLRTSTEVAANFFTDYGAGKELEFCKKCRVATDLRLSRLREDHARTLCRIVDVAPFLVASVRYR